MCRSEAWDPELFVGEVLREARHLDFPVGNFLWVCYGDPEVPATPPTSEQKALATEVLRRLLERGWVDIVDWVGLEVQVWSGSVEERLQRWTEDMDAVGW